MKQGKSRRLLLVLLAASLAFPCIHGQAGPPDPGTTIYLDLGKQQITDWGYDIKEPDKAAKLTPGLAKQLFVEDGMTCLRVPIYGDGQRPAHPARGQVLAPYYRDILAAMDPHGPPVPTSSFLPARDWRANIHSPPGC